MSRGDLPWRQGKRVPIHLYDAQDRPLGTLLTTADARLVVAAVNGEATVALHALQARVDAALAALGETRWNPNGAIGDWASTPDGRNWTHVTAAMSLLRGDAEPEDGGQ
jgi:hypothetical protein